MKKRWILLVFTMLVSCFPFAAASDLSNAVGINRTLKSLAIRVKSFPHLRTATGMFTKIPGNDDHVLFVSNRHVFEESDSLQLIIPVTDSVDNIVDTFDIVVSMKDSLGMSSFVIPDDSLDLAATIISKALFSQENRGYFSSLPLSLYLESANLYEGQAVIFTGYPLGITVNSFDPLVRKGFIAGVDSSTKVIYLDADAYGGSSGSPVFVDFSSYSNKPFWEEKEKRLFVGIISGYKPFMKKYRNIQTGNIEMIQTENSGLAIVMPAEEIKTLAEKTFQALLSK